MIVKKQMTYSVLVTVLTILFVCDRNVSAQKPKSDTISFTTLLRMFADQPDHMADRTIVINDSVIKMKFAKKLDRIRQEFYPLDQADSLKSESYRYYKIITISKLDEPTIAIDPQEKTYADAPEDFKLVSFDLEELLRKLSAATAEIKAESAGIENIEGHQASKIRIKFDDSTEEMYFYFANDMKNLCLKVDSGSIKQMKWSYRVSNVAFVIPDELFELPKDYKRVDFNTMISTIKQKAVK